MIEAYYEFLGKKAALGSCHGFEITDSDIRPLDSPWLWKPHQIDTIKWAVRGGRRAIFSSFGLGKTLTQLEILRIIGALEGGRQLIIAPLGVRAEFFADAQKLGITLIFVRRTEEVLQFPGRIYITNYQSVRDGKLDLSLFNSSSLDEAAVLRSYGSKTFQNFMTMFDGIKYRFVATATPSPNRFKELIHYAGYLGIADTGQLLTMYFQRDSTQANNLTLYPHMEKRFWLWVSTWALFLQKPSDLGYSDDGYALPELHIHKHCIDTPAMFTVDRKTGQMEMFAESSLGVKTASDIKRDSIGIRVAEMVKIIKDVGITSEQFIVWCDQDKEQNEVEKALKSIGISFVSLYGSNDIDTRDEEITKWKNKERQAFVSKPVMYGAGINMQQCNIEIFVGIDFKAADLIQAVHRIYRFQQEQDCHIHLIYTDKEKSVLKILMKKWDNHRKMMAQMTEIIKKYGLSAIEMETELRRSIGLDRIEVSGELFKSVNNDTVVECSLMESDSVDLIHTSIPFANHYEYTPSMNDFGYTSSNGHFWEQMDYLTPNLYRVLKPGRIAAIHVKDRILFGNVTGLGFPTSDNMHEETSAHFQKHGFKKIGMITVVTDVVRENNQTYRLGWTEQCKDGSKMGVGCPEYVLIFRKPQTDLTRGYADIPVEKEKDEYSRSRWQIDAHAFWRSSGDRMLTPEEMAGYSPDVIYKVFQKFTMENVYDYEWHVKIGEKLDLKGCLPTTFMTLAPASHNPDVWHDIARMRTLNGEQARRNVALHVCPLQYDIVDRIITRFSNKNELVFDPFGGLGTVAVRAMHLGRRGLTTELNNGYWADSVRYCKRKELEILSPSLFDFEKEDAA